MSDEGHVCCCCTKQEPPLPCCNAGHEDSRPCPRTGPHVAHRWPPVDRGNRCPGVPYGDPKYRYAEELARRLNW